MPYLQSMSTMNAHEKIPAFTAGDRLRKAREAKTGLDQTQFAEEIGVSRGTVSNYERAESVQGMKPAYLKLWAMRCDVTVEWLETGKDSGNGPTPGNGEALRKLAQAKRARSARGIAAPEEPTISYVRAA